MAYSRDRYTGDGTTTTFAVTFPYINKDHIHVYVNGVELAFTLSNPSLIQLPGAPGAGHGVLIQRSSFPGGRLVNFTNSSLLDEAIQNLDSRQCFYIAQEAFDCLEEIIEKNTSGQWDVEGQRVANAADPVDPQDLVTKQWAMTAQAAELGQAITAKFAAQAAQAIAEEKAAEAATQAGIADAAAAGALRSETKAAASEAAVEADRVEIVAMKADIDPKYAEICAKYDDLVAKHGDVVTKHGEVVEKHAAVLSMHTTVVADHAVVVDKHGDIVTRHADITTKHGDVATKHGDVVTKHGDVVTKHGEALSAATQAATDAGTATTKAGEASSSAAAAEAARATAEGYRNEIDPGNLLWKGANRLVSTGAPSGGNDGDIWFRYV